jgi:glycosyltransferase involved in cell wall biosynthesis
MTIKLPDTTLAAIVRDEMMNPAGGVERWLRSTLPYVQEAVVVDTGSVDGTVEKLSEMQREFPHLRVYQRPFDNFASSRNYSLDQVKTRRALILDADELLTKGDFSRLQRFMKERQSIAYKFDFHLIEPEEDKPILDTNFALNPRLLDVQGQWCPVRLKQPYGKLSEFFYSSFGLLAPVNIKHFLPAPDAKKRKNVHWYEERGCVKKEHHEIAQRDGWKEYNPKRDLYD